MLVGENNNTKQLFSKCPCGHGVAESVADAKPVRTALRDAWSDWLNDICRWQSFITLTVDNDRMCGRSTILKRYRWVVQRLNADLYGNHYVRRVGHSYFNDIVGVEYTTLSAVHLHVAVDMPTNFTLLHSLWNAVSGFAYIEPVTDNHGVADYICKYILKQDDLVFGIRKDKFLKPPAFAPSWYIDNLPDRHPHRQLYCVPSQ
jgi:hypothetical protein